MSELDAVVFGLVYYWIDHYVGQGTFAFFNENVVANILGSTIIDGVNMGEDLFLIETEVGQHGGYIMKPQIEYRNRLFRAKRWK